MLKRRVFYLIVLVLSYTMINADEIDPVLLEEGEFRLRESHLASFFAQLEADGPIRNIRADKDAVASLMSSRYIYYELSFDAQVPLDHFEQTHLLNAGQQSESIRCILRLYNPDTFVPIFIKHCRSGGLRFKQKYYILGVGLFTDTPGWW